MTKRKQRTEGEDVNTLNFRQPRIQNSWEYRKLSGEKRLPPYFFARTGLRPRPVHNWKSVGHVPQYLIKCLGNGDNWQTEKWQRIDFNALLTP